MLLGCTWIVIPSRNAPRGFPPPRHESFPARTVFRLERRRHRRCAAVVSICVIDQSPGERELIFPFFSDPAFPGPGRAGMISALEGGSGPAITSTKPHGLGVLPRAPRTYRTLSRGRLHEDSRISGQGAAGGGRGRRSARHGRSSPAEAGKAFDELGGAGGSQGPDSRRRPGQGRFQGAAATRRFGGVKFITIARRCRRRRRGHVQVSPGHQADRRGGPEGHQGARGPGVGEDRSAKSTSAWCSIAPSACRC